MYSRVPWQCLHAHLFELSNEQAEYGSHIITKPFAIQIGLPEDPDEAFGDDPRRGELGNITSHGHTPNEAICALVKALALLDYRGGIELFAVANNDPADYHVGTIDFEPEKPKVRVRFEEVSDLYGFLPQGRLIDRYPDDRPDY